MNNLKYIIDNYNQEYDFPLFDKTLHITAEKSVITHLLGKYKSLAKEMQDKYIQVDNSYRKLDDLVEKAAVTFESLIVEIIKEVVNDAVSIGLYTLDVNTIFSECKETYFASFYNCYYAFANPFYSLNSSYKQHKQTRNSNNLGWMNLAVANGGLSSIGNAAVAKNITGNIQEKSEIKNRFKTLFNNKQLRSNLKLSVYLSAANLCSYIIEQFPKKHDIAFVNPLTNDAANKARGIYNNLSTLTLSDEQKKEMAYSILEINPFLDDYYVAFAKMFPDNTTELIRIADFFHASQIINSINDILIEFVNNHLGTTEADAEKCQILLDEKVAEYGLKKDSAISVYKIIDEQRAKLDLKYRTIECVVMNTREDADAVREEIKNNKEILEKNVHQLVFRNDYIKHIEKIEALTLPRPLIEYYSSQYKNQLKEFDNKCKNALLYQQSLDGDKKSLKSVFSSITTSAEKQRNDWQEITHNGKYDIYEIMGNRLSNNEEVESESETSLNDHDKAIDDMISSALSASNDTTEINVSNKEYIPEETAPSPASSSNVDRINKSTEERSSISKAERVSPNMSPQYNYENKKSPVVYVMGGIIAFLIVGICILGGILLKNNSSSKPNASMDSNEISVEVSATSNAASSVAEIGTTKAQTTAVEDTVTSITEKSNTSVPSNKEIEEAKNKAVTDLSNNLASTFSSNHMNVPSFNVTTDYDINGDDIPELIISYLGVVTTNYNIYYYNGSQYVELKECMGGLDISETNHLILERGEEGGQRFSYYELSNDYKLNKIDELTSFPLGGDVVYYRNEQQITSSEYYTALDYYKDMNWRSINSNTINNIDSGNNGGSESGASTSSMYSGYANIENAPSDMMFYDNTDSKNIPSGTVNTESTGLNLRKGPGTNYDIIMEIPKGETVYVYGRGDEWCYVGYSSGTGRFNHTDYGYVSRQFLTIGFG